MSFLVMACNRGTAKTARKAIELMERAGNKPTGLLLSLAPERGGYYYDRKYSYSKGYGYGSYGSYGHYNTGYEQKPAPPT